MFVFIQVINSVWGMFNRHVGRASEWLCETCRVLFIKNFLFNSVDFIGLNNKLKIVFKMMLNV